MENVTIARADMLAVADAVAREKSIDRELVLESMEFAIQKAGRSKYGGEHDIRAHIDRKTGEIVLARYIEVVELAELENEITQIPVGDAKKQKPDVEAGDFLIDRLPPIDFGRIAAQTAKQVIVQRIQDAERENQYEDYKDRVGDIVSGIVKREEYGHYTIDLGRGEAVLRRDEVIPRESFKNGDRVRALLMDVRREQKGPQLFLSRTRPEFMAALFSQEVPEIYEHTIEIRRVARDPGSRAKIAVIATDSSIDPVGACVGLRGQRVQAVVNELQGEKIDIIKWTENSAEFVIAALAPAEVSKVILDEDNNRIEVVVPDDKNSSKAIGRQGQNVRLATMLTDLNIDILTEEEENKKRQQEAAVTSQLFVDSLDVDDVLARLLVMEGFSNFEEIAYTNLDELSAIEGFDNDIAEELQIRAQNWLKAEAERLEKELAELNINDDLREIEGFTPEILIALGKEGIKSLEDFAGLATDEITSHEDGILRDFDLDKDDLDQLILDVRVALGWIEDDGEEETEAEEVLDEGDEPVA